MLYAFIGLLFLLADQFLKFWTVSHIELNAYPGKELIAGVLNMTYIKNTGIAFGLMSKVPSLRWILLGLLAAFTVFIVMGLIKGYLRSGLARFSGTLLLAGLLGNGIDRAIYGYVVDMFEPKLGSITWPIFNLADCLVVIFGVLFCISLIAGGIGAPYEEYEEEDDDYDFQPARRRRVRDEEDEEEEVRPSRRPRPRREEDEEDVPVRRPAPAARPVQVVREPQTPKPVKPEQPAVPESDATVQTVARPAPAEKPAQKPAPRPVVKPEKPAAPPRETVKPAEAPKAKASDDEFDLESILAEFK